MGSLGATVAILVSRGIQPAVSHHFSKDLRSLQRCVVHRASYGVQPAVSNLRCPTCGVQPAVSNLRCPTCGVQPLFERPPEISAFQMSGAGLWHIPPQPTQCAICRVQVTHFMYWNVQNDGIHSVVILWSHNHGRFCVSCVRSSGPISGIRAPPEPWMPSKFDTVD